MNRVRERRLLLLMGRTSRTKDIELFVLRHVRVPAVSLSP